MSDLKRWALENPYCDECYGMEPDGGGDYVKADEALARIAELEAENAGLKATISKAINEVEWSKSQGHGGVLHNPGVLVYQIIRILSSAPKG